MEAGVTVPPTEKLRELAEKATAEPPCVCTWPKSAMRHQGTAAGHSYEPAVHFTVPASPQTILALLDERDRLREALDETQRMLEYLWTATGSRAPDMPVCDLFNDDDPLVQDIPTVLGKARMALHGAALTPSPEETR